MFTCIGYVAPEYAMCGYFLVKFDVFSFGVLVLEIKTGQKKTVLLLKEKMLKAF
jgi:hypothetical protein